MHMAVWWCCMWGRDLRGNNAVCSSLCRFSVTSPTTHKQSGPFWCWFPGGWVSVRSGTLWVSKELSCEAGSFSRCCLNPHRCFQSVVWGFISWHWSPGLCGLFRSPVVPPSLSARECGAAQSASHRLAVCPLHPSYRSGWVFLLYLLGCRTCIQFDFLSVLVVFLFLNLLLSFFWLCKQAQCVYLCLHIGWKSLIHCLFNRGIYYIE